jgi:hypothetical protein
VRAYTDDELRMIAAWSDYRKEYGISGDSTWANSEFIAGWHAARYDRKEYVSAHGTDWRAGWLAYHEELDIGGVMR